eukprot:COSAG06_NODE_71251_length_186_cov_29.183908_1_plen_40_part_01
MPFFAELEQNASLCFEVSLCLSRACLGEKIAFKHEWVKAD